MSLSENPPTELAVDNFDDFLGKRVSFNVIKSDGAGNYSPKENKPRLSGTIKFQSGQVLVIEDDGRFTRIEPYEFKAREWRLED